MRYRPFSYRRPNRNLRFSGPGGTLTPVSIPGLVVWLEADEAYCFTDTAGTTRCTDNTVISCWRTAGGLALDFVQAAAESTTRRFRNSGGKKWVEFGGGANDFLATAGAVGTANPVGSTIATAVQCGTPIGSFECISFGDGSNNATFGIMRDNGVTDWQMLVSGNATYTSTDDTGGGFGIGVNRRYMMRCDPVTLQTLRCYRNNSQVSSAARSAGLYSSTAIWRIGTGAGGASTRLYVGRVYATAAYDRDIGAANAAILDAYLAGRM